MCIDFLQDLIQIDSFSKHGLKKVAHLTGAGNRIPDMKIPDL